jgi:hypothetical protein
MLRVEFQNAANTITMRIEGRLVGAFAEEIRTLVARCKIPRELLVDVSDVTYVDAVGEQVLAWLGRIGAEFLADTSYPRDVCERLDLPLASERTRSRLAGYAEALPRPQYAHRS